LKRSLEYNGYEVIAAEDGVQALARLAPTRPDAVIMDIMMPRLDGLEQPECCGRAGHDVPILVLTARDAVGDRVDGLDAAATTIWSSPLRSTSRRSLMITFGSPAPDSCDRLDDRRHPRRCSEALDGHAVLFAARHRGEQPVHDNEPAVEHPRGRSDRAGLEPVIRPELHLEALQRRAERGLQRRP
jgi:CheY-like chemotaxis protein